jgi:hypothetical protein
MLFGKAAHLRIDCGDAALQLGDPPFIVSDITLDWSWVEGGNL